VYPPNQTAPLTVRYSSTGFAATSVKLLQINAVQPGTGNPPGATPLAADLDTAVPAAPCRDRQPAEALPRRPAAPDPIPRSRHPVTAVGE
jgi:hypothetical protein